MYKEAPYFSVINDQNVQWVIIGHHSWLTKAQYPQSGKMTEEEIEAKLEMLVHNSQNLMK